MDEIRKALVDSHIADLRGEADALRAVRRRRGGATGDEDGVGTASPAGRHRPARVRVGEWLIDVGAAVAGSSSKPRGGATGRAA